MSHQEHFFLQYMSAVFTSPQSAVITNTEYLYIAKASWFQNFYNHNLFIFCSSAGTGTYQILETDDNLQTRSNTWNEIHTYYRRKKSIIM